jgi:hypothetical protein
VTDQAGAVGGGALDPIAGAAECGEDMRGTRRDVEPDTVADPTVAVRIVGEEDRDSPLVHGRTGEPDPGGRQRGREADPVALRPKSDQTDLAPRIEALLGLERDRAGQDPAVDLGKRHVHGEVAGRETAGPPRPGVPAGRSEHDLQHRASRPVERGATCAAEREAGGIEHEVWRALVEEAAQGCCGDRVLEAGDVHGKCIEAALAEAVDQGIDSLQVRGLDQGPVEDDRSDRPAPDPAHPERRQVGCRHPRPVEAGA